MAAGSHRADGQPGGSIVQVAAAGHPADVGKIVLIPAPAHDPAPVGDGIFQTVEHFRQGRGVPGQGRHPQRLTQIQQVHVAVVESGADEGSAQVDPLALQRQGIAAHRRKLPAFNGKGIGKTAAGVDDGVVKNLHNITPYNDCSPYEGRLQGIFCMSVTARL